MLYRKFKSVIGVGKLPDNKRKCLYIGTENCIRKVASFTNDEAAEVFESYLEYFLGLTHTKPYKGEGSDKE